MLGRTLLHYEIVDKLGEGGMGVVYKARDPRLQRFVALKVLPADRAADPTRRARLLREARAAATLSHPHIVTVHDITTDGDTDFIVMEHLEGRPLSHVIPARGLPLAEALRLAIQIADALASAHAAGVVHRDLKPGNVVITREGRAKVLDFGLARLDPAVSHEAGSGAIPAEPITREGAVLGTLAYMSPEQSLGETADARSDVFSFGAVLYEMLAGEPPLKGRNLAEQFHALHYGTPTPLRQLRPAVPEPVEQVVMRALERSREVRWPDMRQLERELRRLAAEVASMREELSSWESEAATMVREPMPASGPPAPGTERTSIAVLPFTSLSPDPEDGYMAAGIASEVIVALGGVPDLRVASEIASFRFRDPDADLRQIAASLRIRYVLTGSLRRAGDRIRVVATLTDAQDGAQLWSRSFDRRVEDIFTVQEQIARAIVAATGGQIRRADAERAHRSSPEHLDAWGLLHRAYHFWYHAFSREGLDEALAQVRRAVEIDPRYAAAHAFLGLYLIERVIHVFTDRIEEERAEALAAIERAVELAPQHPNVLENAGLVWYHCSRHERSVGALRQAVQIAPLNEVAWGYLGLSLGVAGDDTEVEEGSRILDRLIETTPEHPSAPYWLYFKGAVRTRQGRLEEAVACERRTLELHPYFFLAAVGLANSLGALGRIEDARATWQQIEAVHPAFTAEAYAREIRLQAPQPERAEPHLAGLRRAGLLA